MYAIVSPELETHFCTNYILAKKVLNNLKNRFRGIKLDLCFIPQHRSIKWDREGNLLRIPKNDFCANFNLHLKSGIDVTFPLYYWFFFKNYISDVFLRGPQERHNKEFFKIKTNLFTYCVTIQEMKELFGTINEEEDCLNYLYEENFGKVDQL